MAPELALDLSPEGIGLLHRDGTGWRAIGHAAPDDPDLPARLAELRAAADGLAGEGWTTELIIPGSQILYTSLPYERGGLLTAATLRPRLDGLTACPVDEMVFDWVIAGDMLRLAIVDRTTLDEAEAFAADAGFRPVRFSARPDPAAFPKAPDFGAALAAPVSVAPSRPAARPAHEPLKLTQAQQVPAAKGKPFARSAIPDVSPLARAAPLALGLGAVAVVLWAAAAALRPEGPTDPAAVLPDTPPPVADSVAALAPPDPLPDAAVAPADAPGPDARADAPVPLAPTDGTAPPTPEGAETTPPVSQGTDNPQLRYAATGIWVDGPGATVPPPAGSSDELYLAGIDPVTPSRDAIALLTPGAEVTDLRPAVPLDPAPAGTVFEIGEDGLVAATPDGALTPDGITVTLGAPDLVPPARDTVDVPPIEVLAFGPDLPDTRPRPRPLGLEEGRQRATLGGRTRTELAGLRPRSRPESAQITAQAEAEIAASRYAVAASPPPELRPANFAQRVAAARAVAAALQDQANEQEQPAQAAAPTRTASAAPSIPTSASVARQATLENAIRLRSLNLIGVYGRDGDRRALVRLPSGRYVKVGVGDNLDGGRIAAIGREELRYVKGGRNITLTIPSG